MIQVVVQEGNLQATMQTQVALLSPSLVVLGSEVIAKEQATTGVQLTGGAAATAGASQGSSRSVVSCDRLNVQEHMLMAGGPLQTVLAAWGLKAFI